MGVVVGGGRKAVVEVTNVLVDLLVTYAGHDHAGIYIVGH